MENQKQIVESVVKINQPNKIIILNNKWCKIESQDIRYLVKVKNHLSYKTEGVEYTAAYRDHGWNGIVYLLTKTNKFPFGLLNNVLEFSKENGFEVIVEDIRPPVIVNEPIDISKRLKQLGMVPRDYQERAFDAAITKSRGILRVCTGGGKTLILSMICAHFNKPTIVCVIGLDLLRQFHELFSEVFDEEIGYVGDGICNIQRITIASIWTIGRSLDLKNIMNDEEAENEKYVESNKVKIINMLHNIKICLIDESHVVTSETIKSIYKNIDPEVLIGCSGTPYRSDNTELLITGMLGDKIVDIPASELIEKGFLAKPIIKFVSVPSQYGIGNKYQNIYSEYIINNKTRNDLIVKSTKELLDKGYIVLLLFKIIKHGKILSDLFTDEGINFEMLYGKDSLDDRQIVKDKLNNGEINLILASTIFDIGINLPKLSGLVLSGSGKSYVLCLQRIGRILRKYPNKDHVAIVDFYDQSKFLKKHSIKRMETYESEPGFKIILSKEMKKFINKNT